MKSNWICSLETLNSCQNCWFFPRVTLQSGEWSWKTKWHLFYTTSSFVHHFQAISEFKLELQSGNAQFGSKSAIFVPCDPEIWRMTLKNKRAPLVCCFKLCASFQIHRWNQIGFAVWKRSIQVKIADFFVPCDLEIWWMVLENKMAPLLYYVKLCAAFQIHRGIQTWVTVRKRSISVKIGDFFVPCDLESRWITLKNYRAPLLYYVKLCASFPSHPWIQTGVTVRKRTIWVKIGDFLSPVTLKFDGWPWKITGHIFYAASSFVHHFIAIIEFKLE